jgi:glycosyltransferase involved in cell wall biosynthesis
MLGQYLNAEIIGVPSRRSLLIDSIPEKIINRYLNLHSNWYSRDALLVEWKISKRLFSQSNNIFHFLYGENSFRQTGKVNALAGHKDRLIATYHQIPTFFEQRREQYSFLHTLDAVVLVSSNQRAFFESMTDANKVHVIPHGVDTIYFQPPKLQCPHPKFNCLTVGSNYRDNDLHVAVIEALNKTPLRENLEFQIIGEPRFSGLFSGIGNVHYMSGVSDADLLLFYQHADIMLMPLVESTANNALLEAMACGLPIIVTDVGGIRDYIDDSYAKLLPLHNIDAMVDETMNLIGDIELQRKLGKRARQKAEESFSWEIISKQMLQLYQSLF